MNLLSGLIHWNLIKILMRHIYLVDNTDKHFKIPKYQHNSRRLCESDFNLDVQSNRGEKIRLCSQKQAY